MQPGMEQGAMVARIGRGKHWRLLAEEGNNWA